MDSKMEFNRITFGLPVESFRIEAYIALEERLPVVTEYVLRLIRICGRLSLPALRDYFGFSDAEALAITEALTRQGLLEIEDEEVLLSQFAAEKFEVTGDEHPRFSKVELRTDTVTFDLLSFTPLKSVNRDLPTDNIIKLDAPEEILGNSIERARSAYHHRFPEIASFREEFREKSNGVYSVESIESKRRTYAPVPVSFFLDSENQVCRSFDDSFASIVSSELLHEATQSITASIQQDLPNGPCNIEEFIQTFNMQVFSKYLIGSKFDIRSYMADISSKSVNFPKGTSPIFGNLYLGINREKILTKLRNHKQGHRKLQKLSTSIAWLIPSYSLWGRGGALEETVGSVDEVLKSDGQLNDLYLCAYADKGHEEKTTYEYRIKGLRELHFSRPLLPDKQLIGGRLEILLYPTAFVFALYHVSLPESPGLWAPVGFVSTLPRHLDIAHKLLRKAMSGNRYGGRARFTKGDKLPHPGSFEEGLPFLNFESLLLHDVSPEGDEEIE